MNLKRYSQNPILKPTKNWWESKAVFNAGVIFDEGKIKILYRAIGGDGFSRFGYAESLDGFRISKRLSQPVYEAPIDDPYERLGVEDPRISKFGKTFYITYTAASVYRSASRKPAGMIGAPFRTRIAILSTQNFQKFNRLGIVLPHIDDKDAVLFPQKISGNYLMLHRKFPNIQIAYSKNLKNWTGHQKIMSTKPGWQSLKIGAGAPPIKTDKGWLMFYHAADINNIYRIGIVVFDLKNPEKMVFRSLRPILEPQMAYEKEGTVKEVPKVVFTCGAAEIKGKFFVYYGASDKYLCLATIKKEEILKEIK